MIAINHMTVTITDDLVDVTKKPKMMIMTVMKMTIIDLAKKNAKIKVKVKANIGVL